MSLRIRRAVTAVIVVVVGFAAYDFGKYLDALLGLFLTLVIVLAGGFVIVGWINKK